MSFGGTALSFLLLTALLLPTAHGGPLDAPVITLGEKKSLFGEKAQANEYVSYALYYWPDPANPEGPYKPLTAKRTNSSAAWTTAARWPLLSVRFAAWDASTNSTGTREPLPVPGNG